MHACHMRRRRRTYLVDARHVGGFAQALLLAKVHDAHDLRFRNQVAPNVEGRPREGLHHHGQQQRREAGCVGVPALQRVLEQRRNLDDAARFVTEFLLVVAVLEGGHQVRLFQVRLPVQHPAIRHPALQHPAFQDGWRELGRVQEEKDEE